MESMRLNTLKPAEGSRRPHVRVGRGIGSGLGKTCGRGIKGSGARKSPNVRPGFEGGQMPMKIRLPKFGFWSAKADLAAEVPLNSLNGIDSETIDLATLKAARLVPNKAKYVKIVLSRVPNFTKKVDIKGLGVTKGAKAAIEAAGGTVEVADYITAAAARRERSIKNRALKLNDLQAKLAATGIQNRQRKISQQKLTRPHLPRRSNVRSALNARFFGDFEWLENRS